MIIYKIYDIMFQLGRLFFVNKIHSVAVGSLQKKENNNDIFSQIRLWVIQILKIF
jgi:hypothetical protein